MWLSRLADANENESYGVTVDYHQLNQVVTPVVSAVPDMLSLLDQINTDPSNWYRVIDLSVCFFFYSNTQNPLEAVSFLQVGIPINFYCPIWGLYQLPVSEPHSPEEFDCLAIWQIIMLVQYNDDIMLIKRGEHKLAGTKCLGNKHVYTIENNFYESTGTCSTWSNFLESQCSELFNNMLCKIKDKMLFLASHVINRGTTLVGLLGFGRQWCHT